MIQQRPLTRNPVVIEGRLRQGNGHNKMSLFEGGDGEYVDCRKMFSHRLVVFALRLNLMFVWRQTAGSEETDYKYTSAGAHRKWKTSRKHNFCFLDKLKSNYTPMCLFSGQIHVLYLWLVGGSFAAGMHLSKINHNAHMIQWFRLYSSRNDVAFNGGRLGRIQNHKQLSASRHLQVGRLRGSVPSVCSTGRWGWRRTGWESHPGCNICPCLKEHLHTDRHHLTFTEQFGFTVCLLSALFLISRWFLIFFCALCSSSWK